VNADREAVVALVDLPPGHEPLGLLAIGAA
jgi:hypothetical protein